jgi:hypothetical protein
MMRLHAIFCVLQLLIVIAGSVFVICGWKYVFNHFGIATVNNIFAWGSILNALSYGLLYGYIGYLMTTLSAPQDPGKSENVVRMLQGRNNSFTIEDDLYQA